mmetsp:Transcript_44801/g.115949  ORF Transcript_44801/g.115949 Transcript_44801/m.115949 type:complete len:274 (-) Transcript_44801:679-1500(-)
MPLFDWINLPDSEGTPMKPKPLQAPVSTSYCSVTPQTSTLFRSKNACKEASLAVGGRPRTKYISGAFGSCSCACPTGCPSKPARNVRRESSVWFLGSKSLFPPISCLPQCENHVILHASLFSCRSTTFWTRVSLSMFMMLVFPGGAIFAARAMLAAAVMPLVSVPLCQRSGFACSHFSGWPSYMTGMPAAALSRTSLAVAADSKITKPMPRQTPVFFSIFKSTSRTGPATSVKTLRMASSVVCGGRLLMKIFSGISCGTTAWPPNVPASKCCR